MSLEIKVERVLYGPAKSRWWNDFSLTLTCNKVEPYKPMLRRLSYPSKGWMLRTPALWRKYCRLWKLSWR